MIYLVAGLVIFLGIHSVRLVAPGVREKFISDRGLGSWKGIYSVVSIIGLILLIWGYGQARYDNVYLYTPPLWLNHLQYLLMIPAMILLTASDGPVGRIKKTVKNPMLIGVKIWAIGHLLVNGDLASLLLFGTFLVWAVLLVIDTKKRGQTFPEKTNPLGDVIAVVGGLLIWTAFMFFLHDWLIGVPLIA